MGVSFIFTTTIFFLFIVMVEGYLGQVGLVSGFNPVFIIPQTGIAIVDALGFVASNVGVFFGLMLVSSTFFIFNSVIIGAYTLSMLYIMLRLIRGGG